MVVRTITVYNTSELARITRLVTQEDIMTDEESFCVDSAVRGFQEFRDAKSLAAKPIDALPTY